jgi:hypothetical protein
LDIGTGTGQWMGWSEHFGSQLWEFYFLFNVFDFYFGNCGGSVPGEATPMNHY